MSEFNKAVLLSINWEEEKVMTSFSEGDDPIHSLHRLRNSIAGDWPDWEHFVIGTGKAREIHFEELAKRMGFS